MREIFSLGENGPSAICSWHRAPTPYGYRKVPIVLFYAAEIVLSKLKVEGS
jgi:hypothetical protein